MKKFNDKPIDKYPTFTICFKGDKIHWYREDNIFDSYALNPTQYELLLKGKPAMMDELNQTSRLYYKKPVAFSSDSDVNIDQYHIRASDFLRELTYRTEEIANDVHVVNKKRSAETFDRYINLSYQSAEKICFTRNSDDNLKSIRVSDLIIFNSSIIGNEKFKNTEIEVLIHHPKQMIKSFDKPTYQASQPHLMSILTGQPNGAPKIMDFRISQIKQQRKRPGSSTPCNKDVDDYDNYYRTQISKKLKCVPPYWKNTFPHYSRYFILYSIALKRNTLKSTYII